MKPSFLLNTKAEALKCRRTAIGWLTFLAAAFLPAINCIILLSRPDIFVPKMQTSPWSSFIRMNWTNNAAAILPVYVILLNNAIAQIEYRNNTWKQVYALPRRYTDIFFSKFIVVLGWLAGYFLLFNACLILSGLATGWINSGYSFAAHPIPFSAMLVITGRVFWGILGVTAVQYWLSLRFKNYIVPLGIGIVLLITGLILMDWDKIVYYPYVYSLFLFLIDAPNHPGTLSSLVISAGLAFAVVILSGLLDIYKLKEKG